MLMLNTEKKVARDESKSTNTELKKIEKKSKTNACKLRREPRAQ